MIDFLPIADDERQIATMGRVTTSKAARSAGVRPLSGQQMTVRAAAVERWRLAEWEGRFPALAVALNQARLAAGVRAPVLIAGERGVGKQWLARAIHHESEARDRPFLSLDAAALPDSAVTGVLFGPLGVYRTDGAATIYIHEPARLSLDVQDELAQRFGDAGPRLIIGTDSFDSLAQSVRDGSLLPAFWDALAVLAIRLPPVRDRAGEMAAIVETVSAKMGGPLETTDDALACLRAYSWPGNLVEVEIALSIAGREAAGSPVKPAHLPLAIRQALVAAEIPAPPQESMPSLDSVIEQVERQMIRTALEKAGGNQTRAAELLSIWRPRLIRRMKALGLDGTDP